MNDELKGKRPAFLFLFALTFILGFSIWMNSQEKSVEIKLANSLEIGRTDLLFGSIASVSEDDELNFYVLDRKEQRVFKFSPKGKLLLAFGQKGQGPGDFQSPGQIVFTTRGELAVLEDLYYVYYFKTDGTFIKRLDLNPWLGLGYIGPDHFYCWDWRPEGQQQMMVDAEKNILKTFYVVERNKFSTTLPDESGRAVMFNYSHDVYVPRFLFAHSGGLSAISISDRYEIALLNESGQTLCTVSRSLKPQKFSGKEKEHLKQELREFAKSKGWPERVSRELIKKIPAFKNQVSAVRISPDFVFVFRFAPDITDKNSLSAVDVFTRKAKFLGTAQLKEVPLFISKRAMYFARADESGNVFLVRTEYSLLF
jgi:hypothetical protein